MDAIDFELFERKSYDKEVEESSKNGKQEIKEEEEEEVKLSNLENFGNRILTLIDESTSSPTYISSSERSSPSLPNTITNNNIINDNNTDPSPSLRASQTIRSNRRDPYEEDSSTAEDPQWIPYMTFAKLCYRVAGSLKQLRGLRTDIEGKKKQLYKELQDKFLDSANRNRSNLLTGGNSRSVSNNNTSYNSGYDKEMDESDMAVYQILEIFTEELEYTIQSVEMLFKFINEIGSKPNNMDDSEKQNLCIDNLNLLVIICQRCMDRQKKILAMNEAELREVNSFI